MITPENIIQHEFIGLNTQITESNNSQIIGLNGTIINETKSMFALKTTRGIKLIPKSNSIWKFNLINETILVDGSKIQKRPFDRYKRYARSTNTIHAHVPECIVVSSGDHVLTAECRPIAKSVSYVVVEVKE